MNNRRRGWFKNGNQGPDPDSFIMTFALGASDSITLPLISTGTYDFVVDWGDGTDDVITAWNQAERVHSYAGQPAGDYVVTITGTCTAVNFFTISASKLKIKRVDQWGDTGLNNLVDSFLTCSNLASIASGLKYSGSSFSRTFQQTKLTSIPSGLFDLCTSATAFAGTFNNCPFLTSIPAGLFDFCTLANNFSLAFVACTGITSIPTDLFRYNTAVTNFQQTFQQTGITSIPTDLFRYNTAVTNFSGTFISCTSLSALNASLFTYNTSVNNFSSCFELCTSLTSIPTDLFRYNTAVTTFGILSGRTRGVFGGCTGITSIPVDLFRYNTSVTSFLLAFIGCTSITSIPTDLFRYNTAVTNFQQTFQQTGIISLPLDLFDYCDLVTTYSSCFSGCVSLTISVSALVDGMDMTRVTTTNQMFSGCTSLTGNGQDLIDKPKAAGYTVGTGTGTGSYRTFFNCTSLTDFATISANYK